MLCTSDGVAPILAIELDDASHARESRRARDAFVDRALTAAAVPLLRIPAQVGYAPAELRDRIERTLAGRAQSHTLDEITL